jgi:hypothetical protein
MRFIPFLLALPILSGCSVKGFPQLEGDFHSPGQLRSAAAIAKAQGQALEEIADQQQGMIQSVLQTAEGVAGSLGAPAVLTGLLGAAGGFLVPTPGQKRREALKRSQGLAEGVAGKARFDSSQAEA